MYLSKVEIDINNRKKMRDLKHLGCYHGWIEDSFPNEREKSKDKRARKLWRIDKVDQKYFLLILSEKKPDYEKLEKYGLKNSATSKNYDQFLDSLEEGTRARFRIKLNTVKSHSDRNKYKKRGRILPVALDELNSFFLEKALKNGFDVKDDEFAITKRDEEFFMHCDENDKKKSKQTIVSATYEGILTITDLEKFKQGLVNGIGKKKAYGCGFLTIIPIK